MNTCHNPAGLGGGQFCSNEGLSTSGNYGVHKMSDIKQALDWVEGAVISSENMGKSESLSPGAKKFLKETVDSNPILYRGIGVIKQRLSGISESDVNNLKIGDEVPPSLRRQVSDISSYTKRKSVAKVYSEGKVRILTQAQDRDKILVDLENLPKVMKKYGISHGVLDSEEYFKKDKEVFVIEPVKATIIDITGRL